MFFLEVLRKPSGQLFLLISLEAGFCNNEMEKEGITRKGEYEKKFNSTDTS